MAELQQVTTNEIMVINSRSGSVAIHNHAFMTEKTIDIMKTFLDEHVMEESGLETIMFRTDGFPCEENRLISWKFFPDSRAAVCNLTNCIDIAIEEAINDELNESEFFNVWAATWLNIIMNFFHEVHHAQAFDVDREALEDPDEREMEEELAKEYANEMIELMAKTYAPGIEPEFTTEINDLISERVATKVGEIEIATTIDEVTDKELLWVECMQYMDEHKLMYYAPETTTKDQLPVTIDTLKEYLHITSGDAENDKSWNTNLNNSVKIGLEAEPEMTTAEVVDTVPNTATTIVPPTVQLEVPENDEIDDEGFTEMPISEMPADNGVLPFEPDVATIKLDSVPHQPVVPASNVPNSTVTTPVIGEKLYDDLGWDNGKVQAIIKSVYGKIAHHIFRTCGFNPSMNPFFTQREKIAEFIPLTADELCIVKNMDCYNESGQFRQNVPVTHGLSGIYIDKAQTLVGYTISMNIGNGNQIRRKFVPQNPWKKKADGSGQYSATALEAQQGNQILWILDPDAVDKSLCTRVRNNVLESNTSGTWCAA
jgi:hypothetical protein